MKLENKVTAFLWPDSEFADHWYLTDAVVVIAEDESGEKETMGFFPYAKDREPSRVGAHVRANLFKKALQQVAVKR